MTDPLPQDYSYVNNDNLSGLAPGLEDLLGEKQKADSKVNHQAQQLPPPAYQAPAQAQARRFIVQRDNMLATRFTLLDAADNTPWYAAHAHCLGHKMELQPLRGAGGGAELAVKTNCLTNRLHMHAHGSQVTLRPRRFYSCTHLYDSPAFGAELTWRVAKNGFTLECVRGGALVAVFAFGSWTVPKRGTFEVLVPATAAGVDELVLGGLAMMQYYKQTLAAVIA